MRVSLVLACCAALATTGCQSSRLPLATLDAWVVEQTPGGTVTARDGAIEIEDAAGCTVWFREKVTAPVAISYDVTVVARGGPHDRVSDVNCFWMAADPR